ncbi:MAG: hypothetical protein J0M20_16670 [Burkholderiales bacterium]|nr:hypothetical protein [Burkholderiales bacterium]
MLVTWLAGCSKIPLSSLWALKDLKLAELDAAALRTVIYLPEGVGLRDGGLAVNIKVARGQGHAQERELKLLLTPLQGAAAVHAQSAPRAGGRWWVLGLSAAEQARLADLRREIDTWRAADGPQAKRQLSLAAELHSCQLGAAGRVPGEVDIDAWVRWKAGQEDVRLLDGATLADLMPDGERRPLQRC